MQDRYTGDVGDFGKYGLLRSLCAATDGKPILSLGIIWYLTYPDRQELIRDDGKNRSYLDKPWGFRDCDPELFNQMQTFKDPISRHVSAIPSLEILPSTTVYYSSPLSFLERPKVGFRAQDIRLKHRRSWFEGAVKALQQADVFFLDPDNGLQIDSVQPYNDKGPKYVSNDELYTLLKYDSKCLILYQHGRRDKEFIYQCLRQVSEYCEGRKPFALLYRRGTQRVFIVVPCKRRSALLLERADRFINSRWKEHFEPRIFRIE